MGFRSDFYKLIKKYKALPYLDEHFVTEIRKGDKYYEVVLEIDEKTYRHFKPTHDSVESLINFMVQQGDVKWWPCDDQRNDPPVVQFCYDKKADNQGKNNSDVEEAVFCSVKAITAFKKKMFSKDILKEVTSRIERKQ